MATLGDFEMRPTISSILDDASKLAMKREDRVAILRKNDHPALRILLAIALHPLVEWDIPEEDPPYTPNPFPFDQESTLYNGIRKFYLYLKPNHLFKEHNPHLTPYKRQLLFIQMLESVDANDAKLLLAIKRKKLPVKLSKDTIEEAFPGLLTWKPQ